MVKHNFLFIRWLQKWIVVQQIQPGLISLIKHYGIMRIWYDFYLVVDNWDTSDFYNKRNLKLDLKRNCSNAESHWNTWAIYCIFIIWQLRFRKTMSSFCGKVFFIFVFQGMLSFMAAPLIGALSDVWGRKPFLILTVTFTCAPIPLMKFSPMWVQYVDYFVWNW